MVNARMGRWTARLMGQYAGEEALRQDTSPTAPGPGRPTPGCSAVNRLDAVFLRREPGTCVSVPFIVAQS
jgi:hypothetical protein